MDFKQFLNMIAEAESTAEKDDKAEKAGKKVAKDIEHDEGHKGKDDEKAEKAGEKVKKDIEYDDKKDKKSLKDWFEIVDRNMIAEAEQISIEPAKQNTQVIKQGTKTLGTVTNPQLAAQIKQSIGKGEMNLAGHEIKEDDVEESGLQAYLGKKKYGKEGMAALQKAGRAGASKEKMAQIRAKHDKLDEIQVAEKAKNPYAIGMAQAMKSKGDKPPLKKSTIVKAHDIAKKIKKTDEGEIPSSGPDYGAGLGAGRKDNVLEAKPDFLDLDKDGNKKESMKKAAADKKKQKVKESMNTCEAAYHEGKAHGLAKHGYACRYDNGSPEHEHYHKGFKEGLDECYGLMPVQGLVVGETMPAATVPGMASQAMPAMEADVEEGNAFTAALAKADKGEKFTVGGKTFTDRSNYDAKIDEFAFESLDKQLNDLLNEGVSVNMQKDIQGLGDDSVSVTATDDDAAKLLDFIKQVGLGGLGTPEPEAANGDVAVQVSDYGAPKFSGHDDMTSLISKVSGGEDYKSEGGCEIHRESKCDCGESKEMVDEVETEDQMLYNVAEDDGEGYEQSQASAAEIDSALAGAMGGDDVKVDEGGDGGEASEEPIMSEESKSEEDDHAEKAGEEVTKDIEYDDKKDEEKKLDEWANDAGKDGTDQAFQRDIDFMTKVISGGLNKPKSTGQQTIPVLAGDKARTNINDDLISEWKRLSGLR